MNYKVRRPLSLKLLFISMLFFAVMISVIVMSLDFYFQHMYKYRKIDEIITQINVLTDQYVNENWDDTVLYDRTKVFSSNNDVKLSIKKLNKEKGEESHNEVSQTLLITVQLNENYYDFFVSSEGMNTLLLKEDQKLVVEGYIQDNGLINVIRLDDYILEYAAADSNRDSYVNSEMTVVNVNDSLAYTIKSSDSTEESSLEVKTSNGVVYEVFSLPESTVEELRFKKTIKNNQNTYMEFAVTASLKAVEEVASSVRQFIPYFLIVSLLFSALGAYLHSKLVAKPIMILSKIADDYSRMDFTQHVELKRNDELGLLSKNLSLLSMNLEHSLGNLKEANEQLKRDYRSKSQQEELRKEFVANASHELKTPLTIIRGYSEALKEDMGRRQSEGYLSLIADEVENMDRLIRNLLKLSKYDAMSIDILPIKEDLITLINDSLQGFEHQINERQLKLTVEGDFGEAFVDYDKIKSVLINLVSNAINHADQCSTIVVRGKKLEEDFHLEIINECSPFTPDQLTKIWTRFYKIERPHLKKKHGTGLGLAIVKSIFEAHNLEFGVNNTVGGVSFWFVVPTEFQGG